jgi:GlcNAc-P-P-Und epimerase
MQEAVVIFGGSGFIGTHLARRLVSEGVHRVISVDRRAAPVEVRGVEYVTADVRDLSSFDVLGPVATIYNFAAVHTTPGHPTHEYYDTNVSGATEVQAFARRKDCNEIIFTSSISVYGPGEDLKSEETPPAPVSAYGWSKLLAERIHRSWHQDVEGRRLVIVRPAVVFGPNENGNFTRLAKMMQKGVFVFPGRTDTIKSCIYVDDLLDAIMFARTRPENYVLFNGAYPDRYTISEIVNTFRSEHFPRVRTFVFPKFLLLMAAAILRPFSHSKLGIHPDRILKLVHSTNIRPGWLEKVGQAKRSRLPEVLKDWRDKTSGKFT